MTGRRASLRSATDGAVAKRGSCESCHRRRTHPRRVIIEALRECDAEGLRRSPSLGRASFLPAWQLGQLPLALLPENPYDQLERGSRHDEPCLHLGRVPPGLSRRLPSHHGPELCEVQAPILVQVELGEHLGDLPKAPLLAPPTLAGGAVPQQRHEEVTGAD